MTASLTANFTNVPYIMWYLLSAPPFLLPTNPNISEIYAVEKEEAVIPCNSTMSYKNDTISLILMYRENSSTPFYTVDMRHYSFEDAKHFASPSIKSISHFNLTLDIPSLVIKPVSADEEGLYKCRTEFKASPTTTAEVRLNIVVLPKQLDILDNKGNRIHGSIGPYQEGENALLRCETKGGDPPPMLSWWKKSMLVDNSYIQMNDSVVINELSLENLQRREFGAKYTCIASNTNLSIPLSSSIIIDMQLKPTSVHLIDFPDYMNEGNPYKLACETSGSRPPSKLSWHIGKRHLQMDQNQIMSENSTVSRLVFTPHRTDHGRNLSCVVHHKALKGSVLMDQRPLVVFHTPVLHTSLGKNIDLDKIVESMDVYFECSVHAYPLVDEVQWYFGRSNLFTNISAGVIAQNYTLVLRNLSREHNGPYQCTAENSVGRGWSEPIHLRVKYSPVCLQGQKTKIAVSIHDSARIECQIDADPCELKFTWFLRNIYGDFALNFTSQSIAYYIRSKEDYGIMCCKGTNVIGAQREPCCMLISPEDPPKTPQNCNFTLMSNSSFSVACHNESLGSRRQCFHLEVFDAESKRLLANITSNSSPLFYVEKINSSSLLLLLYTSNGRGRSAPINLTVDFSNLILLSATDKKYAKSDVETAGDTPLKIYVVTAFGVIFFLLVIFVVVFLVLKNRKPNPKTGHRKRKNSKTGEPELQRMGERSGSPDLIPKNLEKCCSRSRDGKTNSSHPEAKENLQLSDQSHPNLNLSKVRGMRKESVV